MVKRSSIEVQNKHRQLAIDIFLVQGHQFEVVPNCDGTTQFIGNPQDIICVKMVLHSALDGYYNYEETYTEPKE
jgi:hypothetical protein